MSKRPHYQTNPVAYQGARLTGVWALDHRGTAPAFEFFEGVDSRDQARLISYFTRLAELGKIYNKEQFKSLSGTNNPTLFEFKSRQVRLLGAFGARKTFVLAWGVVKKQDRHAAKDLEKAQDLFRQNELRRTNDGGPKN